MTTHVITLCRIYVTSLATSMSALHFHIEQMFVLKVILIIWFKVRRGSTALAVGAAGGYLDIFSLAYNLSLFLSLSRRQPDIDRNTVSMGP